MAESLLAAENRGSAQSRGRDAISHWQQIFQVSSFEKLGGEGQEEMEEEQMMERGAEREKRED